MTTEDAITYAARSAMRAAAELLEALTRHAERVTGVPSTDPPADADFEAKMAHYEAIKDQHNDALDKGLDLAIRTVARATGVDPKAMCLVPGFDGALFSLDWKDALWAKFFMGAPARLRQCVERSSIVKRA